MQHITKYELFESDSNSLTEEQIEFLDRCTRWTWKLNPTTGLVDVDGNFDCSRQNLRNFKGIRFGNIEGSFYCELNNLSSLKGAPQEVGGGFHCSINQLTSLEGAPQEIKGGFYCSLNNLTSLKGAPQEVGGSFYCDDFVTFSWSLEWQIENLEKYPILETIASPESLQKFINENPTKATITLKKIWKNLIKNPKYKQLKFPTSHKEDMDLLADLSDLGL